MTDPLPLAPAMTHFEQCADTDGRLILMPAAAMRALRASGKRSITITVLIDDDPADARPARERKPAT